MTEREPSDGMTQGRRCALCNAVLRRGHDSDVCDPCQSKSGDQEEAAAARMHGWQPDSQISKYAEGQVTPHVVSVLRLSPRPRPRCAPSERLTYREAVAKFQRDFIQEVLARRCGNQGEAAAEMGIHRNTLVRTMKLLGIFPARARRQGLSL